MTTTACTSHCEIRANGVFHTFLCFLRHVATDFNRSAMNQGSALNAR